MISNNYQERNVPVIEDWKNFKNCHSGSNELFGFPTLFNNEQFITLMTIDEYDKYLKLHGIINKE